ncbi:MAG: ATP-binding protein, partial [Phycisphaerae bacterium]
VRNKLIDRVYLPLLGDNLAKQIGTSGASKRIDRQGLLLLISPPGYGKTTLMEYIANRLGLIFMKINGPALGHQVTSLDPAEATNAAAREEVEKLNLALEMGDNVMIYVDDIQHCNPELLQKFISLCDAQRRMEGVFAGKTRTYDLRGKRVCVVMAGNPYTESGEKFRIPDMLANRSDTYNIGDIVGESHDAFVSSYVENALTSNPVLGKLANRSQQDVYAIMHLAETGDREGVEFEGNYGVDEINEYVSTMKKLFTVREVVLKVNQTYIRSAGQADEYRTEPPFLLQGSYRNMNRIASRVLPVMNEDELWTLIFSAYEQDAQTLTSGAEANLLKFRELVGRLEGENARRWAEIRKTYQRNKLLGGGEDDKVGLIIRQLNQFGEGLDGIRGTLQEGMQTLTAGDAGKPAPAPEAERIGGAVEKLGEVISQGVTTLAQREPKAPPADPAVREAAREVMAKLDEMIAALHARQASAESGEDPAQVSRNVKMLTSVLEEQFETMETWLRPVARSDEGRTGYVEQLIDRFSSMVNGYNHLIEVLREKQAEDQDEPAPKTGKPKRKPKK